MTINSLQATQAYQNISQAIEQASQSNNASEPLRTTGLEENSFAHLVEAAINQTANNVQTAEIAGNQVVTGDTNLIDVVTSISTAEVSLEAAIAVRNRIIEAYQEIMRMPI